MLARPLLLLHFLLLTCALIYSVIYDPAANRHGLRAGIAANIAVSAMACQFAFLRLAVLATGWIDEKTFNQVVYPGKMVHPHG
jgi:hypothetical protein